MRTRIWLAGLVAVAAAAVPFEQTATLEEHFGLKSSVPADEAVVEPPTEVRLWFTQVPQRNTTAIRLTNGGGEAVETGEVVQDAEDATSYSVALASPLAPGAYSVAWRGMAADGHVARGDFSFTVATAR